MINETNHYTDISFLSLNVCGIKSKHILKDFNNYISNFDLIGFQETKLSDLDEIVIENFALYTKNRASRSRVSSGGIALAVKRSISNYVTVIDTNCKLVLWFKLSKLLTHYESDILCGIIYIPPESTRYSSHDPFTEIQNELDELKDNYGHFILFGDFNARTGIQNEFVEADAFLLDELHLDALECEYNTEYSMFEKNNISTIRSVRDKCSNNYGYKMIEFCKENNFFILNGRLGYDKSVGGTTCRGVSCIDYFLSNVSVFNYCRNLCVEEFCPLLSDVHNPVSLKLSLKENNFVGTPSVENEIKTKAGVKMWDNDCPEKVVDSIDILKLCEIESKLDNLITYDFGKSELDLIVLDISRLFLDSAQTAFGDKFRPQPRKNSTYKNNSQPWYGRECKEAQKEFIKAKNRYRGSKTDTNKLNMKTKGKYYRRINHVHYRRHVNSNANKIKSLKSSNPKKYWQFITRKQKSNSDVDVDVFYQFMKNLNTSSTDNANTFSGMNTDETSISEQLNESISLEEIKTNALKLVNGKSSGLDAVLNEHIKSTLHLMLPIYHKLFNIIFDTGVIPSAWTEGCIIPIYKNKGNTKNPENYRPITLLSCFGKLFTAIINSRLQTFAQEFDVIGENQTGFRKNYSTMDNVFALHILFDLMSKTKRKLLCAFIDFQKAFDTVWRTGLWRKLIDSHIRGKCFNIIFNLYQGIKSCVSVNGVKSPFFQCSIGVRQGENLSPFLFSIYLNDLENYLRINDVSGIECTLHTDELFMFFKMFVLLYADDTVLLAKSSNDLQHALNAFESFCTEWKLTVNIEKTKIILFGRGKLKSSLKFFYNNTQIEIVRQYKYLGVIFSRGGSFAATVKHNCEQATKAMFVLIRKVRSLNLSIDLQLDLFEKMIKPILLYGCEVWGYCNTSLIERVQLKFLKSIFNLKQSTPNVMVYGEFGIFPIKIDIQSRMVSYWTKIISNDSALKFSNLLYKILYNSNISKTSKWLEYVKGVIINCGFSGIWNAQFVESPKWLVQSIKQKAKDLYINEWYNSINESSSCVSYRLFKEEFNLENYLLKLPLTFKRTLCLFRTRNHRLPIETGKWFNIDIADRKCNLCDASLGDEFHYLLCCKKLALERRQFIKAYYYSRPNVIKFKQLMNTKNISELKKLCKFVKIILNSCSLFGC